MLRNSMNKDKIHPGGIKNLQAGVQYHQRNFLPFRTLQNRSWDSKL